jgi:L-seryl-tRNA(Ser) seleniumtransferase
MDRLRINSEVSEADQKKCRRSADLIGAAVKDIPTMKSGIFISEIANHLPHLILAYDPAIVGINPLEA